MAMIHGTDVLSRRLTQLFDDNKKSYEALVQPRQTIDDPELAQINRKMRIQKDRLLGWGLQWGDRVTSNLDVSLAKAGISELVESIMGSIRELLDEAESLQPHEHSGRVRHIGDSKMKIISAFSGEWGPDHKARLEEILKDLTTSIDTLTDLSRSKVESPDTQDAINERLAIHKPPLYSKQLSAARSISKHTKLLQEKRRSTEQSPGHDGLSDLAFIDSGLLRLRSPRSSTSAPPSYDSIAAGSDYRSVAAFVTGRKDGSVSEANDMAVLLDYPQPGTTRSPEASTPDKKRFEELLLGLLKFPAAKESVYTGIMKLNGWTTDPHRSRCAFVYEIPPQESGQNLPIEDVQPRSLLSFLQHGGDTDSNNMPGLENRLKLAYNVALSILHLHEIDITHRNISSTNLVFFLDRRTVGNQLRVWKGPALRKPYLTGFHQSGSNDPDVRFSSLYHHPALASENNPEYNYVHDYYSLGLILLEIGLWMPIGKFWKSRYSMSDFKDRLQDIYLKKLAAKCGDGYMNAVLACMSAADVPQEGEQRLSDEDAASIQLADFRFNVIEPLERCCRIDISSEPVVWSHDVDDQLEAGQNLAASDIPDLPAKIKERAASRQSMTTLVTTRQHNVRRPKEKQQKIRVWTHELPTLYSQYWSTSMLPKLNKILRKALSKHESYTIDLFMAGKDADTARPTIYMECASTTKVQRILRHLNKEMRLFDIKVVSGQIVRSKAGKKKKKHNKGNNAVGSDGDLNPFYQEKPNCGASIGAYLNGSHLPPVTFGGAILVDGEPYGMSVHHMLEDEEEIELGLEERLDLQRSMGPRRTLFHDAGLSDEDDEDSHTGSVETSTTFYEQSAFSNSAVALSSHTSHSMAQPQSLYPFELSDDDQYYSDNEDDLDNDFWLDPSFDDAEDTEDDEDFELGDTIGISPGADHSLLVTQPALDDVKDGFFPTPEDAADEHLASHTLGHIHASSGLRRYQTTDQIHEIDWALIKLNPIRTPPCLSANDAKLSAHSVLASNDFASRTVHSHTRTSGLNARGTILPGMRLIRMPGRSSPSHSWQVKGSFGAGGDSGAWVFDDKTGAVCGHVLAYSQRSGVAYISPMDVMLQDMEKVLGKRVVLPATLPLQNHSENTLAIRTTARPEAGPLPSKFTLVTVPSTPVPPLPPRPYEDDEKWMPPSLHKNDSTQSIPVATSPTPDADDTRLPASDRSMPPEYSANASAPSTRLIKRKEVGNGSQAKTKTGALAALAAAKTSAKRGVNVC